MPRISRSWGFAEKGCTYQAVCENDHFVTLPMKDAHRARVAQVAFDPEYWKIVKDLASALMATLKKIGSKALIGNKRVTDQKTNARGLGEAEVGNKYCLKSCRHEALAHVDPGLK